MQRFHYIFDAKNIDVKKLNDKKLIKKVLLDLVDICGMKILFGPALKEGMDYNPGISGFVIIDFSHISIHTFSKSRDMAVDIFSCKPYDPLRIKDYLFKVFNAKKKDVVYFEVNYPK